MAVAGQAAWGLPEKRRTQNPAKCFNLASRAGVEQPLTCRIHPEVIVRILTSYVRRPETAQRTIGTLLGCISEGSVVDITGCFPVVHKDTDDSVLLDQEYHKQMLALHQKCAPREVVVGWFSTGDEILATSAVVHAFYLSKESQFTPANILPGPLHLLVNTELAQQTFSVKAFVNVRTVVAESLLQFREVPTQMQASKAETSGIAQLMQARRATREAEQTNTVADIATMDGFRGGLRELLGLFRRMQEYVRAVQAGTVEGNLAVGRGLTAQLCSEPVIGAEAMAGICNNSLQDALMVVYLSNLTKSQINIAEKVQALYGEVFDAQVPTANDAGFNGERRPGICRQFQAGNCSFGDRCRFKHE